MAKELDEYKASVVDRLINLNEEETEIIKRNKNDLKRNFKQGD